MNFLFDRHSFYEIQVGALSSVKAKKRFEFLEAVGSAMDSHLQYFKQVFVIC